MIIIVKNKLLWKMFLCSLTWPNSNKLYSTNMKRLIITEPVLRNIKRVKSVTHTFWKSAPLCSTVRLPPTWGSFPLSGRTGRRICPCPRLCCCRWSSSGWPAGDEVLELYKVPHVSAGRCRPKTHKKAAKQTKYINTHIRIQRHCVTVLVNIYTKASWLNRNICKLWNLLKFLFNFNLMCKYIKRFLHILNFWFFSIKVMLLQFKSAHRLSVMPKSRTHTLWWKYQH